MRLLVFRRVLRLIAGRHRPGPDSSYQAGMRWPHQRLTRDATSPESRIQSMYHVFVIAWDTNWMRPSFHRSKFGLLGQRLVETITTLIRQPGLEHHAGRVRLGHLEARAVTIFSSSSRLPCRATMRYAAIERSRPAFGCGAELASGRYMTLPPNIENLPVDEEIARTVSVEV